MDLAEVTPDMIVRRNAGVEIDKRNNLDTICELDEWAKYILYIDCKNK